MQSAAPTAVADAAPGGGGGGGGVGGDGGGDVVMVKRSSLAACLTCPLCGRLLRDAATISECLHTCYRFVWEVLKCSKKRCKHNIGLFFCLAEDPRKCISEEFVNKEVCCCPTCNIDLGCAPLEKLRVDHSIHTVRSKIFPFKRRKVEDPEVISPVASPVKRKERSLSSLTIHAPRVSIQKCLTKRRTKASCLRSFPLHSTLRGSKDTAKKVGGWRPLGCQLRVGRDRRSLKSGSEDVNRTENKSADSDNGAPASQAKAREHLTRHGNLAKKSGSKKVFTLKGKKKRFKAKQPSKKRRLQALWFYLIAAFDQKGQPPLPQVPTKFLRIKDVDLPASFIQKYLVQKLNLSSEADVEMLCGGKIVNPGMTLHDLADCWLDKGPKSRVRSSVGSPATGFVAKLFYGRPELPPPPPPPPPPPESCHG